MTNTHIHNLLKNVLNLPIGGGSGKSIDDPIIIELTKENDYVGTEYRIIQLLGILNGFTWQVIEQRLNFPDDKKIDQLKIEITQNNTGQKMIKEYFFDITLCFNKLESDVSDYLREKRNSLSK